MNTNTAIVVLAAGASKRLGTPKQLLPYNSSTLLQDTIRKLSQVQNSKIYVVLGAHYQMIAPTIENMSVVILQNKDWESGMSSSISVGISHLLEKDNCSQVLITLADLPLLNSQHYNALLNIHNKSSSGITITKYINNTGVPALFNRKHFTALACLQGDEGAKPLIRKHKSDVAHYEANIAYSDIDTMDDYLKLITL